MGCSKSVLREPPTARSGVARLTRLDFNRRGSSVLCVRNGKASMRTCSSMLAALALTSCATTLEDAPSIPLESVRVEQEVARVDGEARTVDVLMAGDYSPDRRFSFVLRLDDNGPDLGEPRSVTWTMKFGAYCRNRPSWVQSVLTGPSGQVWRGYRVAVPPGPDRSQDWSSGANDANGPGAVATPGLLEAMAGGGRFILALEDDEGQRWNAVTIDTLSPEERQDLLSGDASTPPARPQLLQVREAPRPALSSSPRACPE